MKALRILLLLTLVVSFGSSESQARAGILRAAGQMLKNKKVWTGSAGFLGTAAGVALIREQLEPGETAYVVAFNLEHDLLSSVRWADIFSKPDLFPRLQVAGMGEYIIPQMMPEYSGGRVLWTFKIPQIPSGREVSVFILDDDSTSDQVWKDILSTRWSVRLEGDVLLTNVLPISLDVSGDIQIDSKKIQLDSPDFVAAYTIKTPTYYWGGDWDSEGALVDSSETVVGEMTFSQVVNR